MKVKGKVVLVTGGGSGIGRELVLNLLSKGAKVIAVDINLPALQETLALSGTSDANLGLFAVDITDSAAVGELVGNAIEKNGYVDAIINNAGIIQPFVDLKDLDYKTIKRVIDVNLYGTLFVTKAFLPHLLNRAEGHIVNVSSMGGFLPVPGQTVYGATKAAVKLLTEGLHSELQHTNVHVTVVFPGAVATNITANSGVTMNMSMAQKSNQVSAESKVLTPAKAAEIIVRGIENNDYQVYVGSDSRFLGIFNRISPKTAASFINKQMKKYGITSQ
ncbi:SDR family NAD(P)-dependent oxidoreductase [Mucilaginibacter sp. Mucisp86]|uniref:SDR family NAD(P)-dependent oxidoreductase n=1 Tax=Mucilaginibacter sp. Mucisp86 TaxID=3243060 RepID=UPI0039B6BBC1